MSRRQRLTVVMAVFVAATLAAGAAGAFTDFGSFGRLGCATAPSPCSG
jgi:hypothetical protein